MLSLSMQEIDEEIETFEDKAATYKKCCQSQAHMEKDLAKVQRHREYWLQFRSHMFIGTVVHKVQLYETVDNSNLRRYIDYALVEVSSTRTSLAPYNSYEVEGIDIPITDIGQPVV